MSNRPGSFHVATNGFGATGYTRVGTPRQPSWTEPGRALTPFLPAVSDDVASAARIAQAAPRIPWDVFIRDYFVWKRFDNEGNPSGEHVAAIGPTGNGKSTLFFHILQLHPYSAFLASKKTDSTLEKYLANGYVRWEHWESADPRVTPKRMIWPQPRSLAEMVVIQRRVFADTIERIYVEGFWDLVIDEGYYVDEELGLGKLLRLIYTQIRSAGVSICLGTQRPAWVPVEVYDQSTHLFFWRDNDKKNLDRLREISTIHSQLIREIIPHLEEHQVLYLNTRTGFMCRTRCPRIEIPAGGEQRW